MAKKTEKNNIPVAVEKDNVYVYIGPSIRGMIISGSIWRGTKKQVLSLLSDVVEKYPRVERLIVPSDTLAEARKKVKIEGNSLSNAYRNLFSEK